MEDEYRPELTPLTFGADPGMLPSVFNMVRKAVFIIFVNSSGYNRRILSIQTAGICEWVQKDEGDILVLYQI